jgi:O-antigen/teichoic acid export membrane protein
VRTFLGEPTIHGVIFLSGMASNESRERISKSHPLGQAVLSLLRLKHLVRRELLNAATLFWGDVTARALGFFTVVYLARTLDVYSFGMLGIVWAVYAYLYVMVQAGLDSVGAREVARDRVGILAIVSSIQALKLLIALLIIVIVTVIVLMQVVEATIGRLLVLQSLVLLAVALSADFLFLGRQEMGLVSVGRIVQACTYFLLVVLFVKGSGDVFLVPLLLFASTIAALAVVYKRSRLRVRLSFDLVLIKKLAASGLPVWLSMLMIQVYYNLDVVLLGVMRNVMEAGYYTAAYRIVLLLAAVPGFIASGFYPSISKVTEADDLRELWGTTIATITFVGMLLAGTGLLLAPWILDILYGDRFLAALGAFRILLVNVILISVNIAIANPLLARNKEWDYLKVVSTGAVINVVMNGILIPPFGMIGAAIATLLAEASVFVFALKAAKKIVDIPITTLIFRPVALGGTTLCLALVAIAFLGADSCVVSVLWWVIFLGGGLLFKTYPPGAHLQQFIQKWK